MIVMNELLKKKLYKILKKNIFELILLGFAFILTFISFFFFLKNNNLQNQDLIIKEETEQPENPKKSVYIDVSGAVKKPDVYKLVSGSRLKQAINSAGGLTDDADSLFFSRYFNLARIVNDQEKIYVPTKDETNQGLFENQPIQYQYLDSSQDLQTESLININSATQSQLEELPGVGKVTAQKIIDYRPYQSIDELLNKKIVNKSTYEKIKDLISL